MTRFAPDGSVQSGLNPLARRGSCCCCCSLRSGVIVLAILLMIKSVILSVQWYYYSENAVHYYNDYDYSSDDGDVNHYHAYGHDEGDDVITIDDDSDYPDDEPPQQGGGEYSQGGQGQGQSQGGMGPEQGEGQGQGGPATDTMGPQQGGEMGEGGEMSQQPQQGGQGQGQGQGQGHGGPATDTIEIEEEDSTMPLEADTAPCYDCGGDVVQVEEEEEVDIPVWFSILAWSCVAWHFIGGLLGMFAGCNYKKCCAFMFWMWWVITMTVSFALGVIIFYFAGFHWCLLAMFTVGMAIGIYFTVKVKQFYNLLRSDAQPRAPAGYSDINITAAV